MMFFKLALYVTFGILVYWLSHHFSVKFKYEDFKDYLSLLSGISGMVFTIMGIWIAFLYPNALSRLVDPRKVITVDFSETLLDTKRLENIVAAILKSAIVMTAALLITMAKVFLFLSPIYVDNNLIFKNMALSVLSVITVIQVEAVFSVIFSNVMFINDLHSKRLSKKAEEEL